MSQAFESSIDKRYKVLREQARILVQKYPKRPGLQFERYCKKATQRARGSAKRRGLPFDIDALHISDLMADQKYACAITGIKFRSLGKIDPFGPSLDRIVPGKGYIRGNVRVVCHMANIAMNQWGEESLDILVHAIARKLAGYESTNIDEIAKQYPNLAHFGRQPDIPLCPNRSCGYETVGSCIEAGACDCVYYSLKDDFLADLKKKARSQLIGGP